MKIITDLFNAAARRQRQLESLRSKLAEQQAEHEAAVAADDDNKALKAHASIERTQAEIRAIEAGIATTQRLTAEQQRLEAAEKRAEVLADVSAAGDVYRDLAVEFERDVMALAEKWPFIVGAFEVYRVKAQDAHVEHFGSRGLAPGRVWERVWTQFLGAVKDPTRAPLVMPRGAPVNQNYPSVAESFAREDRAPTASAQSSKEYS